MSDQVTTSTQNPLDVIRHIWPVVSVAHMTYVPGLDDGYELTRSVTHDGTLFFIMEAEANLLAAIVLGMSHAPETSFWEHKNDCRYEVGDLVTTTKTGIVEVGCGKVHGQTDEMRLRVRCSYPGGPVTKEDMAACGIYVFESRSDP